MTSKKLGALLRSVPPATARTETPSSASSGEVPAPTAEPSAQRQVVKGRAELEVPLQVLIPKHIHKQVAVKAAQEGLTLRALVLTAIRSLGIPVTDEEIRDKRGRKIHESNNS
jgi:hypothetical protein